VAGSLPAAGQVFPLSDRLFLRKGFTCCLKIKILAAFIHRIMGNLRKKRRRKISQHKRKKRSRSNRHKKRTWG
jgi:hypothetical protein